MQVRFTARLPEELSDRLEFWAKEAGCSKNDMLIEACRMYGDLKAANLEVSSAALAEYTAQAVEHLKTNNRLFRMDELV